MVPSSPMLIPMTKKTVVMLARDAPMAFRIPISLRFSATRSTRCPMMAKAATSTMMVTITNRASFSSWSAAKRFRFSVHPVAHPEPGPEGGGHRAPHRLRGERIGELHLDAGDAVGKSRELLGGGQGQVGDRRVELVHADLDRSRHGEAPHLGDHPHRGERRSAGRSSVTASPATTPSVRASSVPSRMAGSPAISGSTDTASQLALDAGQHGRRGEIHAADQPAVSASARGLLKSACWRTKGVAARTPGTRLQRRANCVGAGQATAAQPKDEQVRDCRR